MMENNPIKQQANLQRKEKHHLNERLIFESFLERERREEERTTGRKFIEYFNKREQRLSEVPVLETVQRYEVARKELEYKHVEWETFEKKKDAKTDKLLATNQEIISSIKAIKLEVFELNKKIDTADSSNKNSKISAEAIEKFFEEKFKKLENIKAKLEEQNKNIMKQIKRAKEKLKDKDKSNELEFIDFHQLQIENKKYVKEVDEKNKLLLKLKMTIGKITQDKNKNKERLNKEIKSLDLTKQNIESKEKQITKTDEKIKTIEQKASGIENKTKNLDSKQKKSVNIEVRETIKLDPRPCSPEEH